MYLFTKKSSYTKIYLRQYMTEFIRVSLNGDLMSTVYCGVDALRGGNSYPRQHINSVTSSAFCSQWLIMMRVWHMIYV